MLCRLHTLVYQFADGPGSALPANFSSGTWIPASQSSISLLFAGDSDRRKRFLQFLSDGAWGLFFVRSGEWVAYGWCAPPGVTNPPHLPVWARSIGAHWIFYCHTRAEYRREGHYKRLLMQLVETIRTRTANPLILCDTLPENFASRSAVLQTGFIPRGAVTAYYLSLPVLGEVKFGGRWKRSEPHQPEIPIASSGARQSAVG